VLFRRCLVSLPRAFYAVISTGVPRFSISSSGILFLTLILSPQNLYYTILLLYYTVLYYTILYYTNTILVLYYLTVLYYTILLLWCCSFDPIASTILKMVKVQSHEVSLSQQWVGIIYHCWISVVTLYNVFS
jgi:hypothetical protein